MVDEKSLFRLALYGARHALAVTRPEQKGFQDEQVERALEESDAAIGFFGKASDLSISPVGSDVNMYRETHPKQSGLRGSVCSGLRRAGS